MRRTVHDLCLGLIEMPEWMAVTAVTIEPEGGERIVLAPGEAFPGLGVPFTICIDVRPSTPPGEDPRPDASVL